MTIKELKDKKLIILECISGSRAYGLATENSDTDIKGVFVLPKKDFYASNYTAQVNNETNDIVYYELGRFMELLAVNNPNILELLNTPNESILYKDPLMNRIKSEIILSKKCKNTFGRFAHSQIKKARGLKKKIVNPMKKERKTLLDFCYVNYQNGTVPVTRFLNLKKWEQKNCGLVNLKHMKDLYALYYSTKFHYQGIIKGKNSNDIALSPIPKGEKQEAIMYFNKDGYSQYCKEYKEYWNWVDKRNDTRYESTMLHGKNYDAKNMMHTFRLLEMAIEIAKNKRINVKRLNRAFLLQIKNGEFEYEDLLSMADQKQLIMENAFTQSSLPETPDLDKLRSLTFEIRNEFYKKL